ncbi:MAG: hypothetical protein B7X86_00205 [Sphingobacteriales bacterium 17-39-43]|uniref:DUF2130 domain-containing protein n=1 Tax=Daejeonella sp. TaxID=2805397 RepID=UPI000BCD93AC|nr:DUF2130 domain-containing protein [Daejeonella sp.]OYZ32798.1 MAG: hypothetical protein B7Y24_00210 [Sphingobacteriales bacterium 16-39-50]OZA26208.1 MAG: hypothetical protein B7X86_00205 [Sphingobacteriales bacterium 17-39-43]OZA57130.1 MAG: hypothetical protein B7X75_05845 [Sphingobacteriales bacterium 39-40-5]HQT23150.1 DUF2130 domain-containing protein [Daejeonella sp.]HQT56061.1 DUF2130 domain-containing protein [Daejeonella sp.]
MSTEVKCPSCGHSFPLEEAIGKEYEQELRDKMIAWQKKKDEEFLKKEEDFKVQQKALSLKYEQQLAQEKINLEEAVRKSIAIDFENKLNFLENANKENQEKLKLAGQKELEFLKKEQELKTRAEEMEIEIQRKMQAERNQIVEQIKKQELEKNQLKETEHQLRIKEFEKQLEDQKKLVDEMRRKAEQGSMQLQGEVQELILEEVLRVTFPFDQIGEVGKGVRGADCIQVVRNKFGQDCGKIIYESKRTKDFANDWIDKLKKDMRKEGVDVAVIVTQTYPKGMNCFGERDGVWICSFEEVKAVAYVLRDGILRLYNSSKSQENRGDKMHMLYDYLTGTEFSEQWKAIREGYMSMRLSIHRERDAMEKMWKMREKQLDKVLLNASSIKGSIEGIAGADTISLSLSDDEDDTLLLE